MIRGNQLIGSALGDVVDLLDKLSSSRYRSIQGTLCRDDHASMSKEPCIKLVGTSPLTVLWHKGAQGLYPVIDASKELWTELVEKGFLGEKTGKGFFEYQPGEIEHIIRDRDRKLLKILNLLSEEEKKGG